MTAGVLPIVTYVPLFDVNFWWPHLQNFNMGALHFHLFGIRRQQVSQKVSSSGEFGFSCNLDSLEITSCKSIFANCFHWGLQTISFAHILCKCKCKDVLDSLSEEGLLRAYVVELFLYHFSKP